MESPADLTTPRKTQDPRPSTRRWLFAALCAAALLPTALLSYAAFRLAARSAGEQVESHNLAVAAAAAELLGHGLNHTSSAATAFARLPGIVGNLDRGDDKAVRSLLELAVQAEPDVDRAEVILTDGTLWADWPAAPEALRRDVSDLDYFSGVSVRWKPYVSEVFRSAAAPRPWVVAVSVPIIAKSKPAGVLAFQVQLQKIDGWLGRINVGASGYVVVLDQHGTVAAHPRLPAADLSADRRVTDYANLPATREALAGRATSVQYADPLGGELMVAHFTPVAVGNGNWVVISQQPVREAFAPVRRLRWQVSAAAVVIGLLTLWLFAALGRGRRVEREAERFFSVSLDLLAIADMDGYFRRLNRAWEQTLGYTVSELTSEPYVHFVHPDDRDRTKEVVRVKLRSGETIDSFENRYRCRDGSYRWLMWNSVVILEEGLVFAAARDITELKKAQVKLELQNQQLEKSAASEHAAHNALKNTQSKLVQSERLAAIGQLVAGVAHEINNPLAFVNNNFAVLQRDIAQVRGLLQLYRSTDTVLAEHAPDTHRQLREAADDCDLDHVMNSLVDVPARSREGLKRIREIVVALLDMAQVQSVGVFHRGVDLTAGIESTALIIRGVAEQRGVGLELDLAPLPRITCDPKRLNQVILNLLTNALDACASSGQVAARREKKVILRSRPEGDGVCVEVTDNGCGIPADVAAKIFEPFFTTKPPGEGTGLGLSISHGIVAEHGGRLEVQSEPGHGTTFTLHLPAVPPKRGTV